jgi:hypothetical protein
MRGMRRHGVDDPVDAGSSSSAEAEVHMLSAV